MFTLDTTDLQRLAVSAVGAAILTATCVGAAIAPAQAATVIDTPDAWRANVARQIDTMRDDFSLRMASGTAVDALLAVRFTDQGEFAGAEIARSSGNRSVDRHALKVAGRLRYPPLPATMRGRPQTIAMRITFGQADSGAQYAAMTAATRQAVFAQGARGGDTVVAAK